MATQPKVDVVTVGGGWTAAIMGWKLGSAGLRVVSVDRGPLRFADPDFEHDHDPLRFHGRHAMMQDLGKEAWTWRPNPKAPSLPMRKYGSFNPGVGLGGSSIHWTAQLWRFLTTDFVMRSHNIQRYGASKLPAGNRIRDWGITYEELEPYYNQFEYDVGTSGQTGNLNGQIIDGGNPFEAPRSRPYPLPPIATSIGGMMFAKACTQLGYHPFPQPSGITSQAYRDPFGNYRSGCIYCGFCTRYGCEVDAKSSAQTTHVPLALKTGNWTVRPNSTVTRINTDSSGMATGINYVDETGKEQTQPASMVLLTAYTLTNVRMLLLSRGGKHPNGVGNDRGLVGTNYTYQLAMPQAVGVFQGKQFNTYMGNGCTSQIIYDFNGDNFDHGSVDFVGGGQLYAGLGERDPVTTALSYPVGGGNSWGADFKNALRETWDGTVEIAIEGESLPYDDQFLDLDPVFKDDFGLPLLRLTFDFHQNDYNLWHFTAAKSQQIMQAMGPDKVKYTLDLSPYNFHEYQSTHCTGGAIMGTNPGDSVVNTYGQVWDTPNVFVTGAALYPQNPGANPTGTLCPLAYRAADAIRDKYLRHQGHLIS